MAAGEHAFTPVRHKGVITGSVMLATLMQALDTTIANVALPHMQATMSATQDQMGWVLTSYIVATAITIPLSGWLAGEIGRRKVFLTSIVLFTITSALCGMSETLPQIVICRFLQGIAGAALVPLSQAVLFDINAPKDYARAMSTWGIGTQMGPIIGPVLGGWLTDSLSWRWVFYINLPIGVLAFLGLMRTLPERRNETSSTFDFFGFSMLAIGLASLQLMLDRGQLLDWFSSTEIVIETILAGLCLYLFLVHMLSAREPFLKPALFLNRNFSASTAFIFLVGVVMFATLALMPPMLQDQMNYPVVFTGVVTAPRGLGMLMGVFVVARITSHVDARAIIVFGMLITALSLWQMTQFSLQMGAWPVILSGWVQGVGLGFVYVPLTTVAFATLPATLRTEGTAFFNLVRNIGSSIGIAVVIFLVTRNTQALHASLGEHITPYNIDRNPAAIAAHVDAASQKGLAALNAMVTNQGTMVAYIDDFRLMTILTLLTIPFVLLIEKPKPYGGAAHAAVLE
jgi:DHA2 family multidrug resistance protein